MNVGCNCPIEPLYKGCTGTEPEKSKPAYVKVEDVVTWMEQWELIKETSIPLRFKEDFSKRQQRPPLGIIPKWLHDEERREALQYVIQNNVASGLPVREEWVTEYNSLFPSPCVSQETASVKR